MKKKKNFTKKLVKKKNKNTDNQIVEKLKVDRCPECKNDFKQLRSGSKVVICNGCGSRYKYKTKK